MKAKLLSSTALLSGTVWVCVITPGLAAPVHDWVNPYSPYVSFTGGIAEFGGNDWSAFTSTRVTVPTPSGFGMQTNAGLQVGDHSHHAFTAGGAVFYRAPAWHLAGYGQYTGFDFTQSRVCDWGVDGAYYFNRFTFQGAIGVQTNSSGSFNDHSLKVAARVRYDFTDDLSGAIGVSNSFHTTRISVGGEYGVHWGLPGNSTRLFANAIFAPHDIGVIAGIKVGFGGAKPDVLDLIGATDTAGGLDTFPGKISH